jgi:hypothetical protein
MSLKPNISYDPNITLWRTRWIVALSLIFVVVGGTSAWSDEPRTQRLGDRQANPDLGLEAEDFGLREGHDDWAACIESFGYSVAAAAGVTSCTAICLAQPFSAPLCAACIGAGAGGGAVGLRPLAEAVDRCEDFLIDVVPDVVLSDGTGISCTDQDWHYSIDYYPFRGYYEELDTAPYTHDGGFHPGNPNLVPAGFCNGSVEINLFNYCKDDLVEGEEECVPRCIDTFLDEARAFCRRRSTQGSGF